jgi:hypothetical protein
VDTNDSSLHLQALSSGDFGNLTAFCGGFLAESAAVCFEDRTHKPGVSLTVRGISDKVFSIRWAAVTEVHRRCYNDLQDATEDAAYGIAILLMRELTGKKIVERSPKGKGKGFDYWIGESDDDDLIFNNKARLEVSGILDGDDREIASRVRTKVKQVEVSDRYGFPAYIAVIEFGQPKARIELK